MAELILTDDEKEQKSYLNWNDEALGKYVKKKAIDREDYYGENTSKREAAVITLLSEVRKSESDMVMMEVQGLQTEEDLGDWRITFERIDPDIPDGPPSGGAGGGGDDGGGNGGILVP
jgi:hypothetical protein